MKLRAGIAALVVTSLALLASDAGADEPYEERGALTILAGGGLMFASATAAFTAEAVDRHRDGKNAAVLGAQTGMTLAPVLAHGIQGEWQRGLWFAIPGAVAEGGMLALLTGVPDLIKRGPLGFQYAFAVMLIGSVFGGGIGVADAVFADGRRARPSHATTSSSLSIAPLFGGGTTGAMLSGSL